MANPENVMDGSAFEDIRLVGKEEQFSISVILSNLDFTEPCICALIAFHVIMLATVIATRSRNNVQVLVFTTMLVLVYFSESLNQWAALNWSRFSRRQYFDSNGFFISVLFSVPLLFNCLIMIGYWLYQSSDLMIEVKRLQQQRNAQLRKRKDT